jgi:hypothetical protein
MARSWNQVLLPIAVKIQERLVQALNVARRLSAIRSSDEQSTITKMVILQSRSDVIKLQTGLFRMDRYLLDFRCRPTFPRPRIGDQPVLGTYRRGLVYKKLCVRVTLPIHVTQ